MLLKTLLFLQPMFLALLYFSWRNRKNLRYLNQNPEESHPKETPKNDSNESPKDPQEETLPKNEHTVYVNGPISYREHSELTSKDIYHNYWHCRNSEINNQWQRFLFLAVFMILCFTFYGVVVRDLVGSLKIKNNEVTDLYRNVVNGISFLLCVAGVVLSCFWIMMAKASKAWYGIYENAIAAFETYNLKVYEKTTNIKYRSLNPTRLDGYTPPKKDNCLFTSHAGAFSTGGINWAIGFLAFIVWSLLLMMHAMLIGWNLAGIGGLLIAAIAAVIILWLLCRLVRFKALASEAIKENPIPSNK